MGSNPTRSARFPKLKVEGGKWKDEEVAQRDEVLGRIRDYTRRGATIPMNRNSPEFTGRAGVYRYLFEGEDDLLHLSVERIDAADLHLGETGPVARFLLLDVPEAMIWMRPGARADHYYLGHDLLIPERE